MKIETEIRDGLVLNWALPSETLPDPPRGLRYQIQTDEGQNRVFVSALLFHQERLRWSSLPRMSFAWPQMNLRICVLDEEDVPSLLMRRIFLPRWAYPGARLFAGPPVASARLAFPRPSARAEIGEWTWIAASNRRFEVKACVAAPDVGPGPRLGSWERTVRYFHDRPRAYTATPEGLRRIALKPPAVEVWPMRAVVGAADLLVSSLGLGATGLPPVYSSWLIPEARLSFELAFTPRLAVPAGVPHPAASRAALRESVREAARERT